MRYTTVSALWMTNQAASSPANTAGEHLNDTTNSFK